MKIVLTITLVAFLALGLFGISNSGSTIDNVSAQGDGMMGNDTGMMNATLATSGTMNATLAFAQGNDTMTMENDTSMIMNATLPMNIMDKNNTSLIN
jgi:hypothetical protein